MTADAAKRDRTFVLVWRDERGAEICRSMVVEAGTSRIGIPLDAQSVDLPGGKEPGVVWLVRDPATCPACSCPGDVTAVFPAEAQAAVFTARLPRRVLVIEKWTVPGHE